MCSLWAALSAKPLADSGVGDARGVGAGAEADLLLQLTSAVILQTYTAR